MPARRQPNQRHTGNRVYASVCERSRRALSSPTLPGKQAAQQSAAAQQAAQQRSAGAAVRHTCLPRRATRTKLAAKQAAGAEQQAQLGAHLSATSSHPLKSRPTSSPMLAPRCMGVHVGVRTCVCHQRRARAVPTPLAHKRPPPPPCTSALAHLPTVQHAIARPLHTTTPSLAHRKPPSARHSC